MVSDSFETFGVVDSLPPDEATVQHRANIIFLSYRFSQGGIGTQNRMLLSIEENFHSNLLVGADTEEVQAATHKIVGKYFLNQQLHPATAIPWEDDSPKAAIKTEVLVTNELAGLFGRFRERPRTEIASFTSDIAGIAQSVLVMDMDYLSRPGGRAGDSEALKIVVDPYIRDPFDSLYVKYGILGKNTNTVEYDLIFSQLATESVVAQLDYFALLQLQYVIATYIVHHPDTVKNEAILNIQTLAAELLRAQQS